MGRFADKTAVITGAASGIGAAIAKAMADEGARLALADVDLAGLDIVASDIHTEVKTFTLDVANDKAVSRFAKTVFDEFGAVHYLFNNAGVMPAMAPIWEQGDDDWQWVLGVNVRGIANGIRAFVPRMLEQGEPAHIINTASEAAFAPRAFVGIYHASKHAVLCLTETLAQELDFIGADIRVSVVCPGPVNTRVMASERSRPTGSSEAARNEFGQRLHGVYDTALATGMDPSEVARIVVDGIAEGRFYIFPHSEVAGLARSRADAVETDRYPKFAEGLARLIRTSQEDRHESDQ